jgi:hypothetical protein
MLHGDEMQVLGILMLPLNEYQFDNKHKPEQL